MHLIVPKTWGHEKIIANEAALIEGPGYCLKELTVEPHGQACSIHYHAIKTETFYILSGVLMLELYTGLRSRLVTTEPQSHVGALIMCGLYRMLPGSSMTIRPGEPHRFWSHLADAVFIEGSTPDNPLDSYRIIKAGPVPEWKEADVIVLNS